MTITAEQLKVEEIRLHYEQLLEDRNTFPTRANWQYICDNAMTGIGEQLYLKYLTACGIEECDRAELHQIAIEEFPKYLKAIDRDYAIAIVYGDTTSATEETIDLIKQCQLFSADYLSNLIDCNELNFVFKILPVYQPEYTQSDLISMRALSDKLHSLEKIERTEETKGLFGIKSHKTIKGFTEEQISLLNTFDHRLKALTNLIG